MLRQNTKLLTGGPLGIAYVNWKQALAKIKIKKFNKYANLMPLPFTVYFNNLI